MYNKLLAIFSVSLSLFSTDASEQCFESNTKTSRAVFEPVEKTAKQAEESRAVFEPAEKIEKRSGESRTVFEPVEKTAKQAEESRAVFEPVREPTKRIVLSRLLTVRELSTLCGRHVWGSLHGAARFWISQCANGREEETRLLSIPNFQDDVMNFFHTCFYYFSYKNSGDMWLINLATSIYCHRFCENPANKNQKVERLADVLLAVGWCVANKFFIDQPYSNKALSKVFRVSISRLYNNESAFLEGINFRCSISTEEMLEAETFIVNFLYIQCNYGWILDYLPPDACQH